VAQRIRRIPTDELSAAEVDEIRAILLAAFEKDEHGAFAEEDWEHALGGTHFVLELDGEIVTHASVVQRSLHVAGVPIRTGYVEAVATAPGHQGQGFGSAVMRDVNAHIAAEYDLGALGTGSQGFYERLGWQIWRGHAYVRVQAGEVPTPDEDGYIMVLLTPSSPATDLEASISCEWRPGDVW
jgi:aminoglycoside 2'-N-acetyltransferase I